MKRKDFTFFKDLLFASGLQEFLLIVDQKKGSKNETKEAAFNAALKLVAEILTIHSRFW
jgi:hypothetical protein